MPPLTKLCSRCQEELPEEGYSPSHWSKRGACRNCERERYLKSKKKQFPAALRDRILLRKYGISRSDFDQMLARQQHRCLGCRKSITTAQKNRTLAAYVDHDHTTGKVRGLLCMSCNTALGMVKESKATLRRLMAYLDYDRSKRLIYLAGSLKNPLIPDVGNALREAGYDALDDWWAAGPDADDYWRTYERYRGRNYIDALGGRAAQNIFHFDQAYLDLADAVVLVSPAGKSTHLELGYALGSGKPGFILEENEPSRYEVMPNFAWRICSSLEELIESLNRGFDLAN